MNYKSNVFNESLQNEFFINREMRRKIKQYSISSHFLDDQLLKPSGKKVKFQINKTKDNSQSYFNKGNNRYNNNSINKPPILSSNFVISHLNPTKYSSSYSLYLSNLINKNNKYIQEIAKQNKQSLTLPKIINYSKQHNNINKDYLKKDKYNIKESTKKMERYKSSGNIFPKELSFKSNKRNYDLGESTLPFNPILRPRSSYFFDMEKMKQKI